jgi:transposase-like protein
MSDRMKFSLILNHFFKEPFMDRSDLSTLACVNAECQHYGQSGQGHLGIRKVYGRDRIRLWRGRSCQDECSERRGRALFNTKLREAQAINVIAHLDAGWSIRATSRLPKVAKESVARLLKASGRHAQRFHEQEGRDLTPRALEFDEQWSFVKKTEKWCGR